MSFTNPFMLRARARENRITELMLHILEETSLVSQFADYIWENQSLSDEPVSIGLECEKLPYDDVEHAIVVGISKDGIIHPFNNLPGGRADAYFYFRNVKKALILEVKIAANELGKDQLLGHYKICNASTNENPRSVTWDEVLSFFRSQLAFTVEGSKNHYLLTNFLEFARLESLGIVADPDSFFRRFGSKEGAVKSLHEHFISEGFKSKFGRAKDPRTMEYCKRNSESHVAIDLNHNRVILKFRYPRYKRIMEERIYEYFGGNYTGTYYDYPTEANVPIDLLNQSNVQDVIDLFHMSTFYRENRNF
jgi:hypothetical protein